ncbi:trypsin-like peptidase domain-containing protein [Kangiella sediminilitoris]|uniref:von Willebrand factor type A n=1 Tax=Kangiella sediminilitoris TaxID=1144748 RepID=A0A1B3BCJ8_9GAMM|nr:trypsin-like peptidase domain-containing protein [Kangiella sediminilitoris]AOE50539.1 von Willebrand factor type A [Kangiella sediminilitoris]
MSHNTGTVQNVAPAIEVGPGSGQPADSGTTWLHEFAHTPAPGGTKFLMLHFTSADIPAGNRLEVDLGYGTDTFDENSGDEFWTRPINHTKFPGGIPIRYIADGSLSGSVELTQYGRGESLPGDSAGQSNSDPFVLSGSYSEPTYDPFWFCNTPPEWENVECAPPADIRRQVARSCGMIVTIHGDEVSTCSVTLIGPDTVITAGHCLADIDNEWPTSSVTFDYQTDCAGNVSGSYNPIFHKVTGYLKYRWSDGSNLDYAILKIDIPPGGLGIPVIPMRNSLPSIGEQIFGIHHPNGATKKLAPKHTNMETVNSVSSTGIGVDIDVSGGSSGSGLFDMMGRYLGVLSAGSSCNLYYSPSASVLNDIATTPTPAPDQDIMLVIDRSGSMSGDAGTGQSKMDEAKDSASLFVQLVEANVGHRMGLVSFSTAASIDEGIGNLNAGKKNQLIGPAPYSGGAVGDLTPDGWTSIGDGIDKAQIELSGGTNEQAILLLTDGLQNTPPMIEQATNDIGDTVVHAIGFGTESSLNGGLLSDLTQSTGGAYTRAGDGLELKKFFALAFGDIFESGTLTDPTFELPRDANETDAMTFEVCDEELITIVVGWDRREGHLDIIAKAPNGDVITATTESVGSSFGHTWAFIKIPLPISGQREGTWSVSFRRPKSSGEFSTPPIHLRYFMNVIAAGGPVIKPLNIKRHYYTGESFTPLVRLSYPDGKSVHHGHVKLSVTKPRESYGTLLTKAGLKAPKEIKGDVIPPIQATLLQMEDDLGSPLFHYDEEWYELSQDREVNGNFEHNGPWGKKFDNLFTRPGNYTFRCVGEYGHDCKGMRETSWSVFVSTRVDPDATGKTFIITELGSGKIKITFKPQDSQGNLLGPGHADQFTLTDIPGSSIVEPVKDNLDGSYSVNVLHDDSSGAQPGIGINQPGRPTVTVTQPTEANSSESNSWWLWLIIILLLVLLLISLVI